MDNHSFNASVTGMFATSISIAISFLPEIEQWLRIVSLCMGILVGIGSLAIIVKNWNKNNNQ
jgi:hypothetical protein